MRELIFEIPITGTHAPKEILENSQVLHLLRFGTEGYLMICKMSKQLWDAKKKTFHTGGPRKLVVKNLGSHSGDSVLLQVSGLWLGESERRDPKLYKAFEFFTSMEKSPLYALKPPTIDGNLVRMSAVAEESTIKWLLTGLKEMNIRFKINHLGDFKPRNESALLQLTMQQSRILRLAHTMGYYDIPRRTSTEGLARILGMDKGTVGDHLRRAEKHVFDDLLTT